MTNFDDFGLKRSDLARHIGGSSFKTYLDGIVELRKGGGGDVQCGPREDGHAEVMHHPSKRPPAEAPLFRSRASNLNTGPCRIPCRLQTSFSTETIGKFL